MKLEPEHAEHLVGKVMIVDDEVDICRTLAGILRDDGHRVSICSSASQALKRITHELPEVCFLDVWFPDADGVDVLSKFREISPDTSVIMMSGHANIETAVKCTRLGAVDFIEKPLTLDKVLVTLQTSLKIQALKSENRNLKNKETKVQLLGNSKSIDQIRHLIEVISEKNSTVLITGENGTGKEVVARLIHEKSLRSTKPFIAVNCAAIPEELIESELFGHEKGAFTGALNMKRGKFELSQSGTLFLDEIGDMSLKTQSKVLRVIQEHKFERVGGDVSIEGDVRLIAATNKNLEEEMKKGNFREDLFYRLNVIPVHLLPLRERIQDIQPLAEYYLKIFCNENNVKQKSLSEEVLGILIKYPWPGNIRELKNLMERLSIFVKGDKIKTEDLSGLMPVDVPSQDLGQILLSCETYREARSVFEQFYLNKKLEMFGGNVSKTAERIGIERAHLHRKLKNFTEDLEKES